MTCQRFLYYIPWCITDGAVIASGLGYNGKDKNTGENLFDRILNVHMLEIELGINGPQPMMIVIILK